MKHAIYQMDIIPGDPAANRSKVRKWAEQIMEKEKPDVLMLPEMWTTAYTLEELANVADADGEPTCTFLKELARKLNVNIVGGSVANRKNGKFYNSAIVVGRDGEVVYEYDKIHLVPMLNEPAFLTGGTGMPQVFELDGVTMGIIICYDLRFPELARSLALSGAEILYITAEWPKARTAHWMALQIARAIENQQYIVSCNRVGTYDGTEFAGRSAIIGPGGETLVIGTENEEETLVRSLSLDNVARIREEVPVFSSRVPEMY